MVRRCNQIAYETPEAAERARAAQREPAAWRVVRCDRHGRQYRWHVQRA